MTTTAHAPEPRAPRAPLVSGPRGGAALGLGALRSRGFALSSGLALSLTVVGALVERRVGSYGAVDRALGLVTSWVVPLFTLAIVSLAVGRRRLRDATWPVARFGAPRREVALGLLGVVVAASAVSAGLLASLALVIAHDQSAPPLAGDLVTSAWIASLTGGAYAAWLSLGASFGREGGGRYVILALDFTLGRTDLFGVVLPRGNAENLLGLSSPFDLGQRASSALLVALALAAFGVAAWRSRD